MVFKEIVISVREDTASALQDSAKRELAGRLLDRLVTPTVGDPLASLLQESRDAAQAYGLTDEQIDAELALYDSERRV